RAALLTTVMHSLSFRSLAVQPGAEGLGSTSELLPSDGNPREPPTTWIKSQACKMALRVSSFDMDTRDC
uniref:Uncharacterized protein n=1 Tax=Canis lupus dingo TaxID=286419 RepID=A0A8C0KYH3_CANLU